MSIEADIEAIYKATKGLGTREKDLIAVLMQRNKTQLQQLREAYPKVHKNDLVKLIQSETSGNLERVLCAGLWTDAELRCHLIHDGCTGPGTDEQALIDCLMTAYPSQIKAVREVWSHLYKIMSFDTRIKFETGGNLQDVFDSAMSPTRPESGVDHSKMVDDIETFYRATEGKVGTDEAALARLIATRSRDHLMALSEAYKARSPKKLSAFEVIQKETSGNLERALCAAFMPPAYWYAWRLHMSMKGLGTDEKALIRSIFLAHPQEIKAIAGVLQSAFKEDIIKRVKSELSGNLENAVVTYLQFHLSH